MSDILIKLRKDRISLFYGIICLGIGAFILMVHDWTGWIWLIAGALMIILPLTGGRDHAVVLDDKGITLGKKLYVWEDIYKLALSKDFIGIQLKKKKYGVSTAWLPEKEQLRRVADLISKNNILYETRLDESNSENDRKLFIRSYIAFGIYSLYFVFLCFGVFFFDFSGDLPWFGLGLTLILLTVFCLFFAKVTVDKYHRTLDYRPYQILNKVVFSALLFFGAAVTIRLVYEAAENIDGIRGLVTMMWLSPLMILNFVSLAKSKMDMSTHA